MIAREDANVPLARISYGKAPVTEAAIWPPPLHRRNVTTRLMDAQTPARPKQGGRDQKNSPEIQDHVARNQLPSPTQQRL